jgi:ribosome biogenesis GTPase
MDEEDVRVRARGGSPRRTRDRPAHGNARDALVVAVDRGRYSCVLDADVALPPVTAIRGADARRSPVVVGERVALVGDLSGHTDSLARIVAVRERRTVLRRSPDDTDPVERPVVANADLLVCVVALADPPPRTGLIDRVLVAAFDGGLQPVLCLTKSDRLDPPEDDPGASLRTTYAPLGVPVVLTGRDDPIEPLLAVLQGNTSVFFGHSGVGKSTLVNRLVPGAGRATGGVNVVTGRGRHTSSSVVMLALPGAIAPHGWGVGGWVVDTPGVRSFGLGHVSPARVLAAFPDISPYAEHCPPDCSHAVDAPRCALDDAVRTGGADPERLASLRRLLASTPPPAPGRGG